MANQKSHTIVPVLKNAENIITLAVYKKNRCPFRDTGQLSKIPVNSIFCQLAVFNTIGISRLAGTYPSIFLPFVVNNAGVPDTPT